MKVAHCIHTLDKLAGGPSCSVPFLCKGLSQYGVEVDLITYDSRHINNQLLDDSDVNLVICKNSFVPKWLSPNFYRALENSAPDIIHGESIWLPFYHQMVRYAHTQKKPYILTPRGSLEPYCLSNKPFRKKVALKMWQHRDLLNAACIYATSLMEAENIRNLGYTNPIAIIPNGLDSSAYPLKQSIDNQINEVLFLSRIHPKKGLELLIEACSLLPPSLLGKFNLSIVGNGEAGYIEKLNLLIRRKGLENCIAILPPTFGNEKIRLYQQADLFILPSHSENFGMVIAESLCCGTPVITTTNTPWQELLRYNCGWWIDLSVENLVTSLTDALLKSQTELDNMGMNGHRLVKEKYSYNLSSYKTIELYNWILNGGEKPCFIL